MVHQFNVFLWSETLWFQPVSAAAAAASAAKSFQSCLTLCDPIDCSPQGSPVPGILQARTLEWVAPSFSNAWKWKSESEVAQSCPTLSDPMDCSLPGSSVHGSLQARVLEWVAIAFPKHTLVKYQLLLLPLVLVLITTITVNTTTTICRSKLSFKFISSLDFSN